MDSPYFQGDTFDDLLRRLLQKILEKGERVTATKGPTAELAGVILELSNPRARISRTETKGQPFSCLGELCWYLAGTNDAAFISYYIPKYRAYAEEGMVFGGYGPRLFNWNGQNQVRNICDILKRRPSSRQAVIQLFDHEDIVVEHKDVPCTCVIQFMIRQGALHSVVYMRSNDVFIGLPHDVFAFTMLQEIVACTVGAALGTYKHMMGSVHLYDDNRNAATLFLAEGWQSTLSPMPAMPSCDPWQAIDILRVAEAAIRTGSAPGTSHPTTLDSYWADLIRLLQVFRSSKAKDAESIKSLRNAMVSSVYNAFIDKKLETS